MEDTKRITELRKSGKLDEAETLAKLVLSRDPTSWAAISASSWVFWAQIRLLCDEARKANNDAGKSKLAHVQPRITSGVQYYLGAYSALDPKAPDLCHSQILFALRGIGRHLPTFYAFLEGFPQACFRNEDFQSAKSPDGKNLTPLAVTVGREAIKWCFVQPRVQRSNAQWVSSWATAIFEQDPDPLLAMDLALLNARLGRHNDAIKYARKLLAIKRNEPWAWKVLADVSTANSDSNAAAAALCRACELGRGDDFTGTYRISLAAILVQEHQYSWAAKEADHVRRFYESKAWSLKPELVAILKSQWFESALLEDFDAEAARQSRSELAIEGLCEAVQDVDACYVCLNYKRQPMFIADVDGNARIIVDQARRNRLTLVPGESVTIKIGYRDGETEFISILPGRHSATWQVVPSHNAQGHTLVNLEGTARRFKARIRKMPAGFGFLQGDTPVFVGPDLAIRVDTDEIVDVIAIWQLNKKRNEMGWAAVALV